MDKIKLEIITSNNHVYYLDAPMEQHDTIDNVIARLAQCKALKVSSNLFIFTNQIVSIEAVKKGE